MFIPDSVQILIRFSIIRNVHDVDFIDYWSR